MEHPPEKAPLMFYPTTTVQIPVVHGVSRIVKLNMHTKNITYGETLVYRTMCSSGSLGDNSRHKTTVTDGCSLSLKYNGEYLGHDVLHYAYLKYDGGSLEQYDFAFGKQGQVDIFLYEEDNGTGTKTPVRPMTLRSSSRASSQPLQKTASGRKRSESVLGSEVQAKNKLPAKSYWSDDEEKDVGRSFVDTDSQAESVFCGQVSPHMAPPSALSVDEEKIVRELEHKMRNVMERRISKISKNFDDQITQMRNSVSQDLQKMVDTVAAVATQYIADKAAEK